MAPTPGEGLGPSKFNVWTQKDDIKKTPEVSITIHLNAHVKAEWSQGTQGLSSGGRLQGNQGGGAAWTQSL